MSREAVIRLDLSDYSDKISEIIRIFIKSGWEIYDKNGITTFLPEGDFGSFNWQRAALNNDDLCFMADDMQKRSEQVGLVLYFGGGNNVGVSMLAENTSEINLSVDINIQRTGETPDSPVDFGWYHKNLILKLFEAGFPPKRYIFRNMRIKKVQEPEKFLRFL